MPPSSPQQRLCFGDGRASPEADVRDARAANFRESLRPVGGRLMTVVAAVMMKATLGCR
jgi:hypothetical protein